MSVLGNNWQDVFCSDQLYFVQIVWFGVWESETSRYLQIGTSESVVRVGYSILMLCHFELFTVNL